MYWFSLHFHGHFSRWTCRVSRFYWS